MNKTVGPILAAVALALIGLGGWQFLKSQPLFSATPQPISIGIPPNEQSALILIAEEKRFFAANGLDATVKVYETALAAVGGMKSGEVDISQSAEYPIVAEAFKKQDIGVIGSVDKHETVFLVGLKDQGIETTAHLKRKRIGVPRGTITEFYLGRFLDLHGISLQDVTIVDLPFTQSADALAKGSVDAFQVRNRDISVIRARLGSNLVIWLSQSGQAAYEVIAARNDWSSSHPERISRLLKAIARAEEYAISHPAEATAIVQRRLNYDDAYMATVGPQHQYSLTLDQSLVLAMEDEARWMIANKLTAELAVPNFLDYIYSDGLKTVKPGAVNIIR